MNQPEIRVQYRKISEQFAALDFEGQMTAFGEDELMTAFQQAMDEGAQGIVLNFSKLEYMTSSGIGLLVTLFIRANRAGKQLFAVGLTPHYQRIFELTRLNQNIPVFPTEQHVLVS